MLNALLIPSLHWHQAKKSNSSEAFPQLEADLRRNRLHYIRPWVGESENCKKRAHHGEFLFPGCQPDSGSQKFRCMQSQ